MTDFQTVKKKQSLNHQLIGSTKKNVVQGYEESLGKYADYKYPEQHQKLHEMGFDDQSIIDALESTEGNLESATAILLGEPVFTADGTNPNLKSPSATSKSNAKPTSSKNVSSTPSTKQQDIKEIHNKFMATYKIIKCRDKSNHDKRMCIYWHSKGDKRRNPFEIPYTCSECPNSSETVVCESGDNCLKAHNMLERMFHPELFKISMCQRGPNGQHCERGNLCAFAHSEEDHRIPLSQTLSLQKTNVNIGNAVGSLNISTNQMLTSSNGSLDMIQPGKVMSDSRILDTIQEKLIKLIKSQGHDGIISSELPKRYADVYSERLELTDEAGEKFRIKDLLLSHPNVSVIMHKGVQPKYVYEDNPKTNPTDQTSSTADTATAMGTVSELPTILTATILPGLPGSYSNATKNGIDSSRSIEAKKSLLSNDPMEVSKPNLQNMQHDSNQSAISLPSFSNDALFTNQSTIIDENQLHLKSYLDRSSLAKGLGDELSGLSPHSKSTIDSNVQFTAHSSRQHSPTLNSETAAASLSRALGLGPISNTINGLVLGHSTLYKRGLDANMNGEEDNNSTISSTTNTSLLLNRFHTPNPTPPLPSLSPTSNAMQLSKTALSLTSVLNSTAASTNGSAASNLSSTMVEYSERLLQANNFNNTLKSQLNALQTELVKKNSESDSLVIQMKNIILQFNDSENRAVQVGHAKDTAMNELSKIKNDMETYKTLYKEMDENRHTALEDKRKQDVLISQLRQERHMELNHFRLSIGQIENALLDMQRHEEVNSHEVTIHELMQDQSRSRDELLKFVANLKNQLNNKIQISNELTKPKPAAVLKPLKVPDTVHGATASNGGNSMANSPASMSNHSRMLQMTSETTCGGSTEAHPRDSNGNSYNNSILRNAVNPFPFLSTPNNYMHQFSNKSTTIRNGFNESESLMSDEMLNSIGGSVSSNQNHSSLMLGNRSLHSLNPSPSVSTHQMNIGLGGLGLGVDYHNASNSMFSNSAVTNSGQHNQSHVGGGFDMMNSMTESMNNNQLTSNYFNQSIHTPHPEMAICSLPGCYMEGSFICSACGKAGYCGPDHQREHWNQHASECR